MSRLLVVLLFIVLETAACASVGDREGYAAISLGHRYQRRRSNQRAAHCPNPPQQRYELLHDFVWYMAQHTDLRWTLGGGCLLGAIRQQPRGFIQHDDDIDVYMPARDLFRLYDILRRESREGLPGPLQVLNHSRACCGFGWRIYHRRSECSYMDLMILSFEREPYKSKLTRTSFSRSYINTSDFDQSYKDELVDSLRPYLSSMSGVPVIGPALAYLFPEKPGVWVIPESWTHARMMEQGQKWYKPDDGEWVWHGPKASAWPWSYLKQDELFPLQQLQMYNLRVNVPQKPLDILRRDYGERSSFWDDSGHDLRTEPSYRKPAAVSVIPLKGAIVRYR